MGPRRNVTLLCDIHYISNIKFWRIRMSAPINPTGVIKSESQKHLIYIKTFPTFPRCGIKELGWTTMSLFWNFENIVSKVWDANAAASDRFCLWALFLIVMVSEIKREKKTLLEEWKRSTCLPPSYLKLEIETHLQQPFRGNKCARLFVKYFQMFSSMVCTKWKCFWKN